MPRAHLIQIRAGTAAEWAAANPILVSHEIGAELDTGIFKVGDGVNVWTALPSGGGPGVSDHGLLTGLADDDHPHYELDANKDIIGGYAGLDGTAKVVTAEMGTGVADSTKFLRGDRSWQVPPEVTTAHVAAGDPHTQYALDSDLTTHAGAADPHTGYQKESEKDVANGYASTDAGNRVPTARLGSGTADSTTFLRGDQTYATPPGGGGSFAIATTEVDLGSTPRRSGSFTITDAAIGSSEQVIVNQAGGPYTGKGDRADEAEMDGISCMATAGSGSAEVFWTCESYVVGNVKFNYLVEA